MNNLKPGDILEVIHINNCIEPLLEVGMKVIFNSYCSDRDYGQNEYINVSLMNEDKPLSQRLVKTRFKRFKPIDLEKICKKGNTK